jgi:DNA-binding MurR/RpiR family transcriptional regulator
LNDPKPPLAAAARMAPVQDIVYQIRSCRDALSATERKVADAILDDIANAAGATVDQLAQKAGVSIATISRFARSVGCDDTRDLKLQLARASAVGTRFLADEAVPDQSTFYARICADIQSTLQAHLRDFTESLFGQAKAVVRDARMIYVFGMGGASAALASEMQSRLVRLGYPVAAYHDAVLMRMVAATLDERDAVIMLSASGLTPEICSTAAIVRQYGAGLVALTDPTSPLAGLADVVLPIRSEETDFIYKPSSSRYAMLLAIDLLATELALASPQETRDRLRRIKLVLDEYRGGPNRLPLGD